MGKPSGKERSIYQPISSKESSRSNESSPLIRHSTNGVSSIGSLFLGTLKKKMVVVCLVVTFVCFLMRKYTTTHTAFSHETFAMDNTNDLINTVTTSSNNIDDTLTASPFPSNFVWGIATSSYQIEGAVEVDGRGETIWDAFVRRPDAILDHSTGAVADDHYHLWKEDIALMKSLNIRAYRFSIAWSRILPHGTDTLVNMPGIEFYENLIDELLANNIEPWITLFHWDLPQSLQDEFGGWMDRRCISAFVQYARVIFTHFSAKVKHFITLNEPWTYAVNGYSSGIHAPGRHQHPNTEPYLVGHHLLIAHARVVQLYHDEFSQTRGMIGISNSGDFRYPRSYRSRGDREAAERAMLFQWGWFVDPLVFGQYPSVMRERLGARLPSFTKEESSQLRGSFDFLGLNYYSSFLASTPAQESTWSGFWADIFTDFSNKPSWTQNDMGWNVVPDGLREMLLWISERYNQPLLFVTENGSAEDEPDLESAVNDNRRKDFLEGHLKAVAEAVQADVKIAGYFAWSLMDNFEWQFGYQRRFGLCHVDFQTLARTPKTSALWYNETISVWGRNIDLGQSNRQRSLLTTIGASTTKKELPKKVLIGYGSDCVAVRKAISDGVNIVMWSFLDVVLSDDDLKPVISTSLDLVAIRKLIADLNRSGFENVLHFASVGGWNGHHLDEHISSSQWYHTFQEQVGDIFHGIDWDLEGNDDLLSSYNYFTKECLDKAGKISEMAKAGIAPPQSYLDISSSKFSRYVNLTDSDRIWHADFHYFGANVYAYLLQKYGSSIDLIQMQFYESYSKAGQAIYHDRVPADEYLVEYAKALVLRGETMYVNFSDDDEPAVHQLDKNISFPLEKLVFGLGNGWTSVDSHDEKALYITPLDLESAWKQLTMNGTSIRGFMFWTINEEGRHGIFLARELKRILDSPARIS